MIAAIEQGLRALGATPVAARPSPALAAADDALTPAERRQSAALLRVNRAGELAAQALYSGQSLLARSDDTRRRLDAAAAEERDHLAWCTERLGELGGRPSALDPLWYGGSFLIGALAGACGDRTSLGFVAETEKQVEAHLNDHLRRLPERDRASGDILARMVEDEAHHGTMASLAGGVPLPVAVRICMAIGGGVLRRVALVL